METTSVDWTLPFVVGLIVIAIVWASGRKRDNSQPWSDQRPDDVEGPTNGSPPSPPSPPSAPTGPELIQHMERTLGIAIHVESIEPDASAGTVTMRARLMFGRYTTEVAVSAATESKAWEELGRAAIAWRNSDYQHVPMWWGGG